MRTRRQGNETRLSPRRYDTLNPPSCFASRGKAYRIALDCALASRATSSSLLALLHDHSRSEQNSLIVDSPTVTDTSNHSPATLLALNWFPSTTSSKPIVAVMASLEPQSILKPRRAHARPHFASRSLSQIPRFNECHRQTSSQDTAKEEMLALLRSGSQRTTSSAKSSTGSCQSAIGPAVISTSTASARLERSLSSTGSPEPTNTATMDTSLASSSSLSPRARRHLLRSARKVEHILGETPVLRTNLDTPDARNTVAEPTELGVLPSFSSTLLASNAKANAASSLNTQKRTRTKGEAGFGMHDGLANAFAAPAQYTSLTVDHLPAPPVPTLSRVPPVLRVDCAVAGGTNRRSNLGATDDPSRDGDAQSFVSTTTTTTLTADLFSPSTSRRSSTSPVEVRFAMNEPGRELPREVRRSKVAKLSRHLGEHVPSELVFPFEAKADQGDPEPYVLISYENSSPISPLADKSKNGSSNPESKIIRPPIRKTSLRRRRRKSLEVETDGSPGGSSSTPPSSSADIGSVPAKYKPVRTLSRSQSFRSRLRKNADTPPSSKQFSDSPSSENCPVYPASAPPGQTAHIPSKDESVVQVEAGGEKERGTRPPLSDAQRALNVRRAQKMLSMFGDAPPNTMLPVKSKCDSPSAIGRSVMGGTRFKRHSVCSILTSASSFMDVQPATFDSPVSPVTPRPKILSGQMTSTPTRTPTSRDTLNVQTNLSPRRRASLSALPDTPPPFSQYFAPPSPLSIQQDMRSQSTEQSTTTPKASRPQSDTIKHSPHSSSDSSASPPTPRSDAGPAPRQSQKAQDQDPGAAFRERRLRAAKLARFFGVGYGDLYPVLIGVDDDMSVRLSKASFDSICSARMESFEKEKERVKEREKKLAAKRKMAVGTRVSVTVQREVDDPGNGRTALSSSASGSSSDLSLSESEENTTAESSDVKPDEGAKKPVTATAVPLARSSTVPANLLKTTSTTRDVDGAAVGCYGGLGFSSGLTPSRSSSTRRRLGKGSDTGATASVNDNNKASRNVGSGLSFGLGSGRFSLGRQSRRTINAKDSNPDLTLGSGSATLGRNGSTSTRKTGGRALTFGERRSILSRSSCGEFGLSSRGSNAGASGIRSSFLHAKKPSINSADESMNAESVGVAITTTDAQERERERMAPRVRVGEKIADVSEVMAKLRELR